MAMSDIRSRPIFARIDQVFSLLAYNGDVKIKSVQIIQPTTD